jgi:PBP1b-binding outer membrane lipoprotein LpoB
MNKGIKITALVLLSALTLAGCSNSVDNSDKSASSSSVKVKKNSSSRDNKKVTSGELLKVGQWHNDPAAGKVTLERIVSPTNAEINYGSMNFKIKSIKLLKYEPKTSEQKETP